MKTIKMFLLLILFVYGCATGEVADKEILEDGRGGQFTDDEITENGTNFVAPWSPGDVWNYGAGWCSNDPRYIEVKNKDGVIRKIPSTHKYGTADDNCIDINYINSGNSDLGMPFFAVFDGYVVFNQWKNGYGNLLIIASESEEIQFRMGHHNEKSFLAVGEHIKKGQVISFCGSTGNSDSAHGHYCIDKNVNNYPYNPIPFQTINFIDYDHDKCLQAPPFVNIQSTNDFAFQRVEQEFGTDFLGNIINETTGYRGIHWYYDFTVSASFSFSQTDQNNVLVQDWQNTFANRRSAIVYDVLHGARNAYVLHSGFATDNMNGWLQNSIGTNTSGPRSKLGVPISNEYNLEMVALPMILQAVTYQNFMFGYLSWNGNVVKYHEYPEQCIGCTENSLSNINRNLIVSVLNPSTQKSINWSKRFSYLFVDAYNTATLENHWLGFPATQDFFSQVHARTGISRADANYYVQTFSNPNKDFLKFSAIIYDPDNKKSEINDSYGGTHKAYVIRDGFWKFYRLLQIDNRNAWDVCGAPVMNETNEIPVNIQLSVPNAQSYQLFERCYLTWSALENIKLYFYENNSLSCYNFVEDADNSNLYTQLSCSNELVLVCDNNAFCREETQEVNETSLNYCGNFDSSELYCWDNLSCEQNGTIYGSPPIWYPTLPEIDPPQCGQWGSGSVKYPTDWSCCCDNLNTTQKDCLDVPQEFTTTETQTCEQCPEGMRYQCWDKNTCEQNGDGYASPRVWTADCYTDVPPPCGQWVPGTVYLPSEWQCCCGYSNDWQNDTATFTCYTETLNAP
jgi:hypothetical protein